MKRIRILPLLLVLVLLLCACSIKRGNPSELILEDTDFTYYEGYYMMEPDPFRAEIRGRVLLTQEHIQALLPENAPEWVDLKGAALFSATGYLVGITMETYTQTPGITMTISIADAAEYSHLYYRFVDGHPPTVRNDQRYYILDRCIDDVFWVDYSALALIHGVPVLVTSKGRLPEDIDAMESKKASIKKDFEQVLDYLTHIEKGFVENANI